VTIKQLSYKLELSFWHLTINLLSDSNLFRQAIKWGYSYTQRFESREKIKQRVYLIILGTSVVIVFTIIGMLSYLLFSVFTYTSQELVSAHTMPTNGQRNILLIGVDHLRSDNPTLSGIWLIVYVPDRPNVIFAPIFPNPLASHSPEDSNLVNSFALDENNSPTQSFIEKLHQKQLWWHGYLVIDSYAVVETVKFFNQKSVNEKIPLYRMSWNDESPPSLHQQTDLLNNLCRQASEMTIETDFSDLLGAIRSHLHTDMDMISILQDWRRLVASKSDLKCEFPLQRASNP
jgi:hypothetical protein